MNRGIIHFHSDSSYDSITSISKIADLIIDNNLDFAMLTDHDTVKGSILLKQEIRSRGYKCQIPISAEYSTNYGDVIGAFIKNEIKTKDFYSLIEQIHSQGGIAMLPHPYDYHKDVETIAKYVDCIEVFNSRSSEKNNLLSLELSKQLNKPVYYASDAHFISSTLNVIMKMKENSDLKKALLENLMIPESLNYSSDHQLFFSQIIKSIKKKKLRIGLSALYHYVKKLY